MHQFHHLVDGRLSRAGIADSVPSTRIGGTLHLLNPGQSKSYGNSSSNAGQGIGTKIIQELQQQCLAQSWKMRLQVLKGSSAERLYRRLGFSPASEDSLRRQMVWDGTKI